MFSRQFAYALAPCLLALSLTACGEDSFADLLVQLEQEATAQNDILCDCYDAFPDPYESKEACLIDGEIETLTPQEKQCIDEAMSLDPVNSRTSLDCVLGNYRTFTNCLDAELSCTNLMMTYLDCFGAFDAAQELCPDVSEVVDAAIDQCFTAAATRLAPNLRAASGALPAYP